MGISPVQVAALTLTSGLVTGGYFTYQALVPPTLEEHLKTLNIELISSDWGSKETKYKQAEGEDLIPSISKGDGKSAISNFATDLQNWCEKKKTKYFLGKTDLTYKRFSLWCLVTQNIDKALTARGLKQLSGVALTNKFQEYSNLEETNKFLEKKSKATEQDLTAWCNKKKAEDYKYEGDIDLEQLIKWCYSK